jgi:hypothetical protein
MTPLVRGLTLLWAAWGAGRPRRPRSGRRQGRVCSQLAFGEFPCASGNYPNDNTDSPFFLLSASSTIGGQRRGKVGYREQKEEPMSAKVLSVLFVFCGSLLAQSTTVLISDTNGNQTTGTISNGNVYFHDSKGNIAFGTIRGGNVFLSTGKGEITFGTISGGNVFLTDPKGITTGTIQNGNIFLSNSDGSITTGSYDKNGNVITSTTPSAVDPRRTTEHSCRRRRDPRRRISQFLKAWARRAIEGSWQDGPLTNSLPRG